MAGEPGEHERQQRRLSMESNVDAVYGAGFRDAVRSLAGPGHTHPSSKDLTCNSHHAYAMLTPAGAFLCPRVCSAHRLRCLRLFSQHVAHTGKGRERSPRPECKAPEAPHATVGNSILGRNSAWARMAGVWWRVPTAWRGPAHQHLATSSSVRRVATFCAAGEDEDCCREW